MARSSNNFDKQKATGANRLVYMDPAKLIAVNRVYQFTRKAGNEHMSPSSLKGTWLAAFRMLKKHRHFSDLIEYYIMGSTLEEIASEVGVNRSSIYHRIEKLRAQLIAAFPELKLPVLK